MNTVSPSKSTQNSLNWLYSGYIYNQIQPLVEDCGGGKAFNSLILNIFHNKYGAESTAKNR